MKHLWIASSWINSLLELYENNGLDIDVLVQGLPGFEEGSYSQDMRLDLLVARQLWHRADRMAKDPLLGLKIGMSASYRSIGILAPLAWHSPTIAKAFENFATFQALISENGSYRQDLSSEVSGVRFVYEDTPAVISSNPQQMLSVMVGAIRFIHDLSGGKVKVLCCSIPKSLAKKKIEKELGIPVAYSEKGFSIDIDPEFLCHPIPGCDEALYQQSLAYATSLLDEKGKGMDLINKVKRFVANNGLAQASMEGCAEQLNAHPRNLQRMLSSHGTSFRTIKDDVLRESTIRELNQTKEVKCISENLGYSEPSAFFRAFKGWFGMTPKAALKEEILMGLGVLGR